MFWYSEKMASSVICIKACSINADFTNDFSCSTLFPGQNEACDSAGGQNAMGKDGNCSDADRDHFDSSIGGDSSVSGDSVYLVVYMIDAFLYGQHNASSDGDDANATRLATIGLFQCYLSMLKFIPEHLHSCIQLQVSASQ
jgi:hypothetical protein